MKTFGKKKTGLNYIERPGVYAIIRNTEHKVATVKTSTEYFHPGGGIKSTESHRDCLIREVAEELGWQIEIRQYIGCARRHFYATDKHAYYTGIAYFYIAEKLGELGINIEDDHHETWLTLEEMESMLFHEHQLWAVERSFRL